MEVTVTEANSFPPRSYVSIRVGDTRRQAPLKLNEPFRFPSASSNTFKVEVLSMLGGTQLSTAKLKQKSNVDEIISIPNPAGTGAQSLTLKINAQLTDPAAKKQTERRQSRHQAALNAQKYLDEHNLQTVLQTMVQQILIDKPKEPLEYMVRYLEKLKVEGAKPGASPSGPIPTGGKSSNPALYLDPTLDFPLLETSNTIMAEVLMERQDLYYRYRTTVTNTGFTFDQCIQCGLDCADEGILGCVVGDEESVSLFRDFYGLVVAKRHGLGPNGRHPTPSPMLIDPTHIKADSWDPSGNVILSARLRINRSIGGFALPPAMDAKERAATEQLLGDGLSGLTGEVAGQYHRLAEMSPEFRQQFVDEQQLFSSPTSPYFQTTKMGEGWPDGRGFFLSTSREVLAWVNEDDHLKLMVIKKGGDVKAVVTLMREAVTQLDTYLASKDASFIVDEQFGHITSCPSMWGTGLKLSLLMKLPHLAALSSFPPSAIAHMGVRVRPEPSGEGLFDVTNARAMGASEADIISEVANGVERLIQWEQGMAKGDASKVQQDIQELNG
mmetsp:Transcript_14983/g.35704  ORF Transcript_14983/g.35704 Transcript_14983/m.35704 type:complete len:554 (-) Transcript_14983:107-1768(-)